MRIGRMQKCIALLSAGVICLSGMASMSAEASAPNSVLQMAGVDSMLTFTLTKEECMEIAEQAKGAAWGYTNLGIADVETGNLNVRETPSTEGKMVGKMRRDAACEILDIVDGWAHVTSGEVEGYVSLDFLLTGPDAKIHAEDVVKTVAIANTDGLNVRDEANTNSAILTQIIKGEELEFIEDQGDWIKVSIDGDEAYVAAEYVKIESKLETAITMSELMYGQGVSNVRVDLVEYAKQFLGNPYVWGGTSLTKGADCSGFVLSVFKKYGYSLPHYSGSQAQMGKKISASDLKPGDLVFYSNSKGTINHVSIYIGGGQAIHASSPKTGIKISKYNYRTPAKCVRIIND